MPRNMAKLWKSSAETLDGRGGGGGKLPEATAAEKLAERFDKGWERAKLAGLGWCGT